MKKFGDWFKNNLSTFFSVVGILLTIYFSVFYIPSYIQEMKNEKIRNMNLELITTVQELIYKKQYIDKTDLLTFIKGKEIKYNLTYPYSITELLIQTQESFIDNKFIPLEERKQLVESIDLIRAKINNSDLNNKPIIKKNKTFNFDYIFIGLSAIIGLVSSIYGFMSIITRQQREKEVEIEKEASERISIRDKNFILFHNFEKMILQVLNKLRLSYEVYNGDRDLDIIVKANNKYYGFILKYRLDGEIGDRDISYLINLTFGQSKKIEIFLVANCNITHEANKTIMEHNNQNKNNRINYIRIENEEEAEKEFIKIFNDGKDPDSEHL